MFLYFFFLPVLVTFMKTDHKLRMKTYGKQGNSLHATRTLYTYLLQPIVMSVMFL